MNHKQPPHSEEPLAIVGVAACDDYAAAAVQTALAKALEPLGGMSAFVSPGQTVLVNPNLLSPRPPEHAVTTHPALVAAIVSACRQAGAATVWVGDSPAGNHDETRLWRKTGMADAVRAAGGVMKSFRGPVSPTPCHGRKIPAPAWLDQVDVLISAPKLKTHMLTLLTCALKNVYGMIPGESKAMFHGDYPSPRAIAHFLAEVFSVFRPQLNIVDAIQGMEGNGPSTGQPVHIGMLLASEDAVAIDACCAGLLGLTPEDIPIIRYAAEAGLGTKNLQRIQVRGDVGTILDEVRLKLPIGRFLQGLPEWAFRFLTLIMTHRPTIDPTTCVRCGLCAEICSQKAIAKDKNGRYQINRSACILCMCCLESCPHDAISVRSPVVKLDRLRHAIRQTIRHTLHGD